MRSEQYLVLAFVGCTAGPYFYSKRIPQQDTQIVVALSNASFVAGREKRFVASWPHGKERRVFRNCILDELFVAALSTYLFLCQVERGVRQAAAIALKNTVRRRWSPHPQADPNTEPPAAFPPEHKATFR